MSGENFKNTDYECKSTSKIGVRKLPVWIIIIAFDGIEPINAMYCWTCIKWFNAERAEQKQVYELSIDVGPTE